MIKFVPWTNEEAAEVARESSNIVRPLSVNNTTSLAEYAGFLKGVSWAAAQIEKCPSLYAAREGSRIWGLDQNKYDDTMEAKLVGVRKMDK